MGIVYVYSIYIKEGYMYLNQIPNRQTFLDDTVHCI